MSPASWDGGTRFLPDVGQWADAVYRGRRLIVIAPLAEAFEAGSPDLGWGASRYRTVVHSSTENVRAENPEQDREK